MRRFGSLVGGLLALLCLTACTSPQPQEQSTSPEVVQTQEVSPKVENTQAPEATQTPEVTDEETTPSEETEGTDIPDESVEFGD
mgnify:FL=1